jgi:hypothetical protein
MRINQIPYLSDKKYSQNFRKLRVFLKDILISLLSPLLNERVRVR